VLDFQTGRRGDHFVALEAVRQERPSTNNPHYNATITAVKKLLQLFLSARNLASAARRLAK
jgi:hypothetical protein